ncbi:heparinase II/III family protein [Marinilabiliaceae bacterium N1Y90]|nr:heparinase II/III family protein [Marinilabiliaceae bacterium N1Y90]
MFLGEDAYTDEMQLQTIATLLQHGAHLYETNAKFKSGNHQTRGMSALAMLAILFRDFEGTDLWYQHAMEILQAHMQKEINADGFQFERSVHYHMSDIANYFYVYQLANISSIEVDTLWEAQLKSLFTTLAKVAYPDKSAPVLQDDTDDPWAEKNNISGTMTLGYVLFDDPQIGYFAEAEVRDKMYWFLNQKQLQGLNSIDTKKPEYGSLFFPYTHYYIMREGWSAEDKMMITSAGLDKDKPDHQHGDMLGIQAIAYGKTILPNYQVRYSLKDYDLFKNSLVKNVALVDNELQGKQWTSNKGGSGFGKFKSLPQPNVITWESNDDFDLFVGTHDGFENVGVKYSRQVVYVKDEFWIVKDNFNSESSHTYKQVWQGHYTSENGADLLRSSFDDATGCDIFQLIDADEVTSSGARGKQWNIVSKADQKNYSFLTIIYPYKGYGNRIDESKNYKIKGWEVNTMPFKADGEQVRSLSNEDAHYVFNVRQLTIEGAEIKFSDQVDICLIRQELGWELHLLSDTVIEIERASKSISLKPGEKYKIK